MGPKTSKLEVSGVYVRLGSDCDAIDTISLSYKSRSSCCSCFPRRRVIACFRFAPIDTVQGLGTDGVRQYTSTTVATVNVAKMNRKDGNTPVRVSCLAGGVPVLVTDMELADLLERLRLAQCEDKSVLTFSLSPQQNRLQGQQTKTYTLFCNDKPVGLGDGGAQSHHRHTTQQQQHDNIDKESHISSQDQDDAQPKPTHQHTIIRQLFPDVPQVEADYYIKSVVTPLDDYVQQVMEMYKDSLYHQLKDGEPMQNADSSFLDEISHEFGIKEKQPVKSPATSNDDTNTDEIECSSSSTSSSIQQLDESPQDEKPDCVQTPPAVPDLTAHQDDSEAESSESMDVMANQTPVVVEMPLMGSPFQMMSVASPLDEYVHDVMKTYKDSPYYTLKEGESMEGLDSSFLEEVNKAFGTLEKRSTQSPATSNEEEMEEMDDKMESLSSSPLPSDGKSDCLQTSPAVPDLTAKDDDTETKTSPAVLEVTAQEEWTFQAKSVASPLDVDEVMETYSDSPSLQEEQGSRMESVTSPFLEEISEEEALCILEEQRKEAEETPRHRKPRKVFKTIMTPPTPTTITPATPTPPTTITPTAPTPPTTITPARRTTTTLRRVVNNLWYYAVIYAGPVVFMLSVYDAWVQYSIYNAECNN